MKKLIIFTSGYHFYCVHRSPSIQMNVCAFRYEGQYISNAELVVCCVFVMILEGCGVVNPIITLAYKIYFLERYFGKH